MKLLPRLGIFIVFVLIAVVMGSYLGKISVRDERIATSRAERISVTEQEVTDNDEAEKTDVQQVATPVFFCPGAMVSEDWKVISEEVAMAASSGIHRYIITISPSWFEQDRQGDAERYNALLKQYVDVDAQAQFLIQVNLNPPVHWFEVHPEAAMQINEVLQPYPSPASVVWQEAASSALENLIATVGAGAYQERVLGYVLCALQNLRWMLPEGYDRCTANQQGFIEWLQQGYRDDDALQIAWGNETITLETVTIPEPPVTEDALPIFLELPARRAVADFLQYSSESVADALTSLSAVTARVSAQGSSSIIAAPYAYSFETLPNDCGHFALELLLESDINAFVSPVSYVDRGLGGVGGVMGPVDSMTVRGKQWIIIDDTRTGVERDSDTGEFGRIKGINVDDVYDVQRRNFAMALTYGLGLIWSDPQGEGWLHDQEQWEHFGQLNAIYADQLKEEDSDTEEVYSKAVMTVVVDESSRFYMQGDNRINSIFLQKGRDAALRAGVSLRFHLLRDVIEDIAPPTSVYLFLNAFHLSETDRVQLHSRLAREHASAIWLYAPGYIAQNSDVENIAATTGMDVRQFEEPFETGSKFLLSGNFLQADEKFGYLKSCTPAFYIEQGEETDFLATYVHDREKGSVAILSLPEGWTSVYVAEPGLSPALLCEILLLLEQHLYLTPVDDIYYDAVFIRDDIVSLHASKTGKRSIHLGGFCDVVDLLEPAIGWSQKDRIMLPLQTGETRLLLQKPTE